MFGKKAKIQNSNNWKKQNFRIPMFGKVKILKSYVWKKAKFRIPILRKSQKL